MIELERTAQVWGIYGNLGGGKTLTAVSMMYQALADNYYVVSNVRLNLDEIRKTVPNADKLYTHIVVRREIYNDDGSIKSVDDFNPFTIPSGSPRGTNGGKRVLVVLDECAEWFDQYSNLKSPTISRVMSWLRHSSKRSQDVVFIVQRREYLNKSFRILVSRWVSVDDMATFRLPMLRIHPPFLSPFCLASVFDRTGIRCQTPQLIKKSFFGKFYDTAECLAQNGHPSDEYTIPKRKSKFPLIAFLLWIASVILSGLLM